MKAAAEVPTVLTVHLASPGQYVVRIGDQKWFPLIGAISKLLDDAKSLIVITPTDTKVLTLSANGAAPMPPQPATEPEPVEVDAADLDAETMAAIEEQEALSLPGATQPVEEIPGVGEVVGETQQGTKVVRRKRNEGTAGRVEKCGRCSGAGEIRSFAGPTKCPVCQGEGIAKRYGRSR